MLRSISRKTRVTCAAIAFVVSATPLMAGPPWISIEMPGNPYEDSSRGAFLIVHAFHHGAPVDYPVAGVAETMVNGQRKSVPLTFQKTSRAGAYALKKQWTDGTVWVLALTVTQAKNDEATALVTIAADGHASKIETLSKPGEKGMLFPRAVAPGDIDAALRAAVLPAGK